MDVGQMAGDRPKSHWWVRHRCPVRRARRRAVPVELSPSWWSRPAEDASDAVEGGGQDRSADDACCRDRGPGRSAAGFGGPSGQVSLRPTTRWWVLLVGGGMQDLGQVNALAAAAVKLVDLCAAAETVCHDQGFVSHVTKRGEQDTLGAVPADGQMPGLAAEVSGQSAAAGVQPVGADAHVLQQGQVVLVPHDGVLVMTLLATWSCPVEIQVNPQHTGRSGMVTRQPADSRTCTAACPIWGWKLLVKVSGHSSTLPRSPVPLGVWPANHCCRV